LLEKKGTHLIQEEVVGEDLFNATHLMELLRSNVVVVRTETAMVLQHMVDAKDSICLTQWKIKTTGNMKTLGENIPSVEMVQSLVFAHLDVEKTAVVMLTRSTVTQQLKLTETIALIRCKPNGIKS